MGLCVILMAAQYIYMCSLSFSLSLSIYIPYIFLSATVYIEYGLNSFVSINIKKI